MSERGNTVRATVEWVLSMGAVPVKLRPREKRPVGDDWGHHAWRPTDFGEHDNIGIKVGADSSLVDVDLDCEEVRQLAPRFLPRTNMMHGRPSAQRSHYWYRVAGASAYEKLIDPMRTGDRAKEATILELRGDEPNGQKQTMIPPSIHPSGEVLAWDEDSGPTEIACEKLQKHTRALASAALLARHWPGARHDASLAVSGMLARAGWKEEKIAAFVTAIASWVNRAEPGIADGEPVKRRQQARDSISKLKSNARVTGVPTLIKLGVPDRVIGKIREWLALPAAAMGDNADLPNAEDSRGETTKPQWPIESASPDWIREPLPPREHLLVDTRTGRGAVDHRGAWLFGGAGGAGKSYATIDLALAIIGGGQWLDTFSARQGRALLVAAEDEIDDVRRRVHAIGRAKQIDSACLTRLSILPLSSRVTSLVARNGDVYTASADTISLCAQLGESEPYDLVVVDPYGRIAGVSVDADNAAAAATISALNSIATAARGLVLGVTHTSLRARLGARNGAPEGATGIRGATGQSDYARGVIRLEHGEDGVIYLSLGKANHVAPWEPVALRRGEHGELMRIEPEDLPARVDKAAAKEAERRDRDRLDDVAAREAIGKHPGASLRQLRALVCGARACGKDRADAAIDRVRAAAGADHE